MVSIQFTTTGSRPTRLSYFFLGTFAPFFLASERPIAIACFLLLTLFPAFPDFSFPRFRSCIASRTVDWALRPYFPGIFASLNRLAFEVPGREGSALVLTLREL